MSTRILRIKDVDGIEHTVGASTDEVVCVSINYKRDGNPVFRGKDGCYEVIVVSQADLAKKEEKQEKKEPPAKVLYTIPGGKVACVTLDIADPPAKAKKEEKPIVLERVQE